MTLPSPCPRSRCCSPRAGPGCPLVLVLQSFPTLIPRKHKPVLNSVSQDAAERCPRPAPITRRGPCASAPSLWLSGIPPAGFPKCGRLWVELVSPSLPVGVCLFVCFLNHTEHTLSFLHLEGELQIHTLPFAGNWSWAWANPCSPSSQGAEAGGSL